MWHTCCTNFSDGSINGNTIHQSLRDDPGPLHTYRTTTSSAGTVGPKHQNEPDAPQGPYNVAGQDVFGHSPSSIFLADGHGKNGQMAALNAIEMHKLVPVSPEMLQRTPLKKIEHHIREKLVTKMLEADFPYSGSTFTSMAIVYGARKRWIITVNIGDSEAHIVYKDRMHTCSLSHTWDDLVLYNRYVKLVDRPRNVCYNRWNASKHQVLGPDSSYRPVMLYDIDHEKRSASVNPVGVEWVSNLWKRFNKPSIKNGTQSVRVFPKKHQNWGSSVIINGRARGQNMAYYGDCIERELTKVPIDMIHVYIHEIEAKENIIGIIQSDGVANKRSIEECWRVTRSTRDASKYLEGIENATDDMSACMIVSEPIIE